jgi:hypothetical protein
MPVATDLGSRSRPSRVEQDLEIQILLTVARGCLDPANRTKLQVLLREAPDWRWLLSLALFHRLFPLLYWHVNAAAADSVSEEHLNLLRGWFVTNAANALECTAELLRVLHAFRDGGVFAVPYKGPSLASRLYGNVALRPRGDLDILVGREDVARARSVLEESGYRPWYPASQASREFALRNRYSEIFVHEKLAVVELHWAFTSGEIPFPLTLEQVRPRLEELELGGSRLPAFATEDLLLILCAHGAKHCWNRLEWLSGLSELIRKESVAWDVVLSRAAELQAEKVLFLGLFLAHDLLESPVPSHLIEEARSQSDVMRLATIVEESLATVADRSPMDEVSSLPRDLFRLRLQPSYRHRLRYILHRITTPRREDTRLMLPLGRRYVPLPAFLRPFRAVSKLVSVLTQRSTDRRDSEKRRHR